MANFAFVVWFVLRLRLLIEHVLIAVVCRVHHWLVHKAVYLVDETGRDLQVVTLIVVLLPISLTAGSAHSRADDFTHRVVGRLREGPRAPCITREAVQPKARRGGDVVVSQ